MASSVTPPLIRNCSWQQTMLRVKDPLKSVPFYEQNFGMTLIDKYDFADFSLYFLALLRPGVQVPPAGTPEAHQYLWTMQGTCLELTHNHGTENNADFTYNNGNVEPNRGFGHIAFNTEDVYASCAELEAAGVKFQKKPDEGRMKGLAFALDPDGYWIEIVRRAPSTDFASSKYNLSQTMIRVKDPVKSLAFYREKLGMRLISERHFPDAKFSLYFLASIPDDVETPDPKSEAGFDHFKSLWDPVLELTHNHGTESDESFSYHNGNTEPRGFGHIGFLVDNVREASQILEDSGVNFKKRPDEGTMRGIAFALDPDNYWVELIERGLSV